MTSGSNLQTRLRVSVVGLFIADNEVLLLDQVTPPEPNRWDLPGGGLEPSEDLLTALRREVREETGLENFEVERLLTIAEGFYPEDEGKVLHTLNVIYLCAMHPRPMAFSSNDPEIGARGIRWLPISEVKPETCTTRTWKALQAAVGSIQPDFYLDL